MLSKSDFFGLPELRQIVYPSLSLVEHGMLLCVSQIIESEVREYIAKRFKESNDVVFNHKIDHFNRIGVTRLLKHLPLQIEKIKRNLPLQQFFHDMYWQYHTKTCHVWDEKDQLNYLKENQIILDLRINESQIHNTGIASDMYSDLFVLSEGRQMSKSEKWDLNRVFSSIVHNDRVEGVFKNLVDTLTKLSDEEKQKALALYQLKTTNLELWSNNPTFKLLKVVIQNAPDYNWVKPLTIEQVRPFEEKIKKKLGKEGIIKFMNGHHAARDTRYCGASYYKNEALFYDKLFQYCYSRGKINYQQLFHHECSETVLSLIKQTWVSFDWLTTESGWGFTKSNSQDLATTLVQSPKDMLYINTVVENKEQLLAILGNRTFTNLMKAGLVTLEECVKFTTNLLNAERFFYASFKCLEPVTRHEMELFCEGLGSPAQYSKGLAIRALIAHKEQIQNEKHNIEGGRKGVIALLTNGFFKQINGDEREKQCRSIKALIAVLRKEPGCILSEEQISVLTNTLGTHYENDLAKLIRTMLLEPLAIKELTQLDIDSFSADINHASFV